MAHDALDIVHGDRVHTGEGLVEQHEARLGREGTGNFHAASLAARQAQPHAAADVADVQFLEQGLERGVPRRVLVEVGAHLEDGPDVVLDRELAEHRGLLRQVAHAEAGPAVHRQSGQLLVVEPDAAGVAGHQSHDHVEGGGLAGAVRPEQADHLAGIDLERQVDHDLPGAIALAERFGPQPAHGRRSGAGEGAGSAGDSAGAFGVRGAALSFAAFSRGLIVMRTPPGSLLPGFAATRCRPMS